MMGGGGGGRRSLPPCNSGKITTRCLICNFIYLCMFLSHQEVIIEKR